MSATTRTDIAEDELLSNALRRAVETSPFYRDKYAAAGADAMEVRSRLDLAALPFTEKDELRQSQRLAPPLGETQGAPIEDIVRIQGTGGSSGPPILLPFTSDDLESVYEMGARCLRCAGARPDDIVIECFNYSLYVGGLTDHLCFERAGCCVLPYGTGQSERLLQMMSAMQRPLLMYSTPAYPLRLAEVADSLGLDPRVLNLRKAILSGEGGLAVPSFRERLEEIWGCSARDLYGLAEIGCIAAECDELSGLHVLTDSHVLIELIDPATEQPVEPSDGLVVELVYTTLRRRAGTLIRFRAHDLVEVLTEPCACGRDGFRIRPLGRTDDMFIVRGVNVFPLAVGEILWQFSPQINGQFQIVLDNPPPIDYDPLLVVEANPGQAVGPDLEREIADRVKTFLNFRPRVSIVPSGAIPRPSTKAKLLRRVYEEEAQ